MNVLMTTAYWPNLHYFFYVLNSESILLEQHEHYQKQSYRNRTSILTANGQLDLVIPVSHRNNKQKISEIEISYAENWQIKHWRAITSAYKNSPFFEFFEDEIRPFYFQKQSSLILYNLDQLTLVLKILRVKKSISLTGEYHCFQANVADVRNLIHPKIESATDKKISPYLLRTYYQTFGNKFGFTPNLSILDLLFNCGLQAKDYFPRETLTL